MSGVEASVAGRVGTLTLDLGFTCRPGTVTAITGPSGAGKTTVLRWLAGLQRLPGSLIVAGEDWQALPAHRRRVGMVFQGQGLLPHLSVRGNLDYSARRAEAPLPLDDVARRTGIAALLDRNPDTLSGGEAQRASIARALIARPTLLLLDEPLSALDGEARGELATMLERLFAELAMTVILVSHDVGEVARLAGQLIRMGDGRIEA